MLVELRNVPAILVHEGKRLTDDNTVLMYSYESDHLPRVGEVVRLQGDGLVRLSGEVVQVARTISFAKPIQNDHNEVAVIFVAEQEALTRYRNSIDSDTDWQATPALRAATAPLVNALKNLDTLRVKSQQDDLMAPPALTVRQWRGIVEAYLGEPVRGIDRET